MNSFTNGSIKYFNTEDSKSNSTIQLKFSESFVQMLSTTNDNNSNSYQTYGSRKRCPSTKSQIANHEESEITNKKHRTHQFVSLSESSDGIQKQNKTVSQRSVSIQNVTENNFEWWKDFIRQSLDVIRDTVVHACLTAISTQSVSALKSNISTRDININNHNHQTRLVQSDHRIKIPLILRPTNDLLLFQNTVNGEKIRVHHRARSSPYPTYRNLIRTAVNDSQVPWSYEWLDYQPITFTANEVHINSGADPDLLKMSSSISLHFNTIDGAIDRRSVYQPYGIDIQNGLPLNPIGRTGLQGRGILLRWGANVYHYIMICRWKRDVHGRMLVHSSNGKKILEILLEIQADSHETNDLILTGGLRMLGSRFPPQLQDRLKHQLFQQNPIPWKGAYFDDARNTDNAWIELSIEYILDDDYHHHLTSGIPSLHEEQLCHLEQPRFIWKDVHNTINIGPRTHYRLIRNLAYKLDANF
ncbi:hypothetical protein I4U23_008964 [Adineta vaga]|nr:hypothetical protein I4U23_008964 [Adineta vaga]